ncbi:MAG: N-acetyl-gamma-glutamyl-phosphate reductase, partial [uncultured Acidimicrobiales bacterium]
GLPHRDPGRLRLHRGGASAAARRPPCARGGARRRRLQCRQPRGRGRPRAGRRLRGSPLRLDRSCCGRRRRPGLLLPAPRNQWPPGARDARPGRPCRRPRRRLPAARPRRLPALVRPRAPAARPPGPGRLRAPRALPRALAGCSPGGGGRLLRDGQQPGADALRAGRGRRADRRRRRRLQRGERCRADAQAQPALLCRRRGPHGLRPDQAPPHPRDRTGHRGTGAVHAAPGPRQPGHPRHRLRPCSRSGAEQRGGPGGAGRRLPGRAVRGGIRALAVDKGDVGLQRLPADRTGRSPDRLVGGRRRARQPRQGRQRPGPPVRKPGARPRRDPGPAPRRGLSM